MDEKKVIHEHVTVPTPVQESVEITRGQKGGYGWTVKAGSVERVAEIDAELRTKFGGEGA